MLRRSGTHKLLADFVLFRPFLEFGEITRRAYCVIHIGLGLYQFPMRSEINRLHILFYYLALITIGVPTILEGFPASKRTRVSSSQTIGRACTTLIFSP
jgi:hypothetical protein